MTKLCPNCSFCGAEFPDQPAVLKAHIFMCQAHPAAMLFAACKELVKCAPKNADPKRRANAIIQADRAIVAARLCIDEEAS